MRNLIIGLTGRFGAGCTETAKYFVEDHNFISKSISGHLKNLAQKEYKNFEKRPTEERRRILQDLGDTMRKDSPDGTVSALIEEIAGESENVVIECFRNPTEVEAFRKAFGYDFYLLAIDAKTETRWSRLKKLYADDKEKFIKNDLRDAGEDKECSYGQNVKDCMAMADVLINSDENFYCKKGKKDTKVIDRYGQKLSDYYYLMTESGARPPTEDELFMHQACSVAMMSRCSKRGVGAVIVKEVVKALDDKKEIISSYVVSTGVNNVPNGLIDCSLEYEEKCYRAHIKNKILEEFKFCRQCGSELSPELGLKCNCGCDNENVPGGKMLDICRALHAEENAIVQAAKLGSTSIDGTILYSSTFPCMLCCKKIIEVGIKKVFYHEAYPMGESLAEKMFKQSDVEFQKFEGVNFSAFQRLFR